MLKFENDLRSQAEQLLLSALLNDNGCVQYIDSMRLSPAEFSHDLHGQIFRHIVKLMAMNEPADQCSVFTSMTRHRRTYPLGLFSYLCGLAAMYSVPAHAGYYACMLVLPVEGTWP
jgi:replicative DNA helicase